MRINVLYPLSLLLIIFGIGLYLNIEKRGANALVSFLHFTNSKNDSVSMPANIVEGVRDTLPPEVPLNLAAFAPSDSQINVSWDAPRDNIAVTGYKIYRNDKEIGTTIATRYVNIRLSPSKNYSFSVAAYDAAGNISSKTKSVNMRTLAKNKVVSLSAPINGILTPMPTPNSIPIPTKIRYEDDD